MIDKSIQKCFEKICENFGVAAGLNMSGPLRPRCQPGESIVFIDMNVGSYFNIDDQEILRNIIQKGIKSKKDYRKLRNLVRMRIINSLRSIQDLTDDSLRSLGVTRLHIED